MRFKLLPIVRQLLLAITATFALQAPAAAEPLVDAKQVEAWADQYYGQAIAQKRSSGIVISVVQDGKLIFTKGYGHADLGRGAQVSPESSGFQIGSITKTFIATAVGQLVDSGKIKSLDDPVNRYLKRVKLPGERGARVTIRQLLNHRAGFEEQSFGALNNKRGSRMPLPLPASEIEHYMPALSMESGGAANYSNWGFSVLGFMIEDISGQRIDHYLRDNIWRPLGMTHTAMNLGKEPANTVRSYKFEKDGTPVADRVDQPHPWIGPAGAIVSTATDMAKYMNAHILQGENGGYPLLSPKMFREFHTESYRNTPVSFGFAHTFWVNELNGSPTIEHSGGTPSFQNMMVMIPEKRFGFYVSAMMGGLVSGAKYGDDEIKAGKAVVHDSLNPFDLRQSFVQRFLKPTKPVHLEPFSKAPNVSLAAFAGTYWLQARNFTTIEALVGAFDPTSVFTITLTKDGKGLQINGYGPYVEVANGVFASKTASDVWADSHKLDLFKPPYIGFRISDDGKVEGMTPNMGHQLWEPASPIFNAQGMLKVAGLAALITLTGALLVLWPQGGARLRHPANYLGLVAAAAVISLPLTIMVGFDKGDSLMDQAATGEMTRLWMLVIESNALLVIGLLLAAVSLRSWLRAAPAGVAGWASTGYRLHLSLVALAALAMTYALGFYNLLGVHL